MKIPIIVEENNILKNLETKTKLKLKKLSFFKKINNRIELNHEDIVVDMGIIINPIFLKKIILTKIFKKTEAKEI